MYKINYGLRKNEKKTRYMIKQTLFCIMVIFFAGKKKNLIISGFQIWTYLQIYCCIAYKHKAFFINCLTKLILRSSWSWFLSYIETGTCNNVNSITVKLDYLYSDNISVMWTHIWMVSTFFVMTILSWLKSLLPLYKQHRYFHYIHNGFMLDNLDVHVICDLRII